MKYLRRVGLSAIVAVVLASPGATVFANEAGVNATVTVASPCLTVTPPVLDFGTLPFSFPGDVGHDTRTVNVNNCGANDERLFARSTDASLAGQPVWTLSPTNSTPCLNHYSVRAYQSAGQTAIDLSTSDAALDILAAGGSSFYDSLVLIMPCTGSTGAGEVVSFNVTYTATF